MNELHHGGGGASSPSEIIPQPIDDDLPASPHGLHPIEDRSRLINYLRISITDRCNLACRYCVPKTSLPSLHHKEIARYEEILHIVEIAAGLGITKIRVTGGEPLVRKGVFSFIQQLSQIKGIGEIALTTNGVLLEKNVSNLIQAGVHRINVSLDTLKPERFKFISGKDAFHQVWRGIMEALEKGLSPVKLNAVVLKGINDDEIADLAQLSLSYPIHMRFIEYMPMGNSDVALSQQMLIPEIRERIENAVGPLRAVAPHAADKIEKKSPCHHPTLTNGMGAGPAKRFKFDNGLGEIGFISPVSSHFCHECNRLRLTSTGKLRPCLLKDIELDILTPLRQGASKEALEKLIIESVAKKPAVHFMVKHGSSRTGKGEYPSPIVPSQMSTIGG